MTEVKEIEALTRIVDGWIDPDRGAFILRYNRPDGETDHIAIPNEDLKILADIVTLNVRQMLGARHPSMEAQTATSFDLGELPGADTIVITFTRGREPATEIALPRSVAERLQKSLALTIPMIGGTKGLN